MGLTQALLKSNNVITDEVKNVITLLSHDVANLHVANLFIDNLMQAGDIKKKTLDFWIRIGILWLKSELKFKFERSLILETYFDMILKVERKNMIHVNDFSNLFHVKHKTKYKYDLFFKTLI